MWPCNIAGRSLVGLSAVQHRKIIITDRAASVCGAPTDVTAHISKMTPPQKNVFLIIHK